MIDTRVGVMGKGGDNNLLPPPSVTLIATRKALLDELGISSVPDFLCPVERSLGFRGYKLVISYSPHTSVLYQLLQRPR